MTGPISAELGIKVHWMVLFIFYHRKSPTETRDPKVFVYRPLIFQYILMISFSVFSIVCQHNLYNSQSLIQWNKEDTMGLNILYFYFKLEFHKIFFIRLLMKFTGGICPRSCDFRDERLKRSQIWHQHK